MLPMSFLAGRLLVNGCNYEEEAEEGLERDISMEDEQEGAALLLALVCPSLW